ncbi:GFA family protein [Sinorhizobium sp. BG8]|uniref:GFA family protein n=1 Tax=Sinorhizobium sp. BG8 TaxID=2613773 RepID=UPI00193D3DF9|nr:GFA family protein [Sinorhizobium sp. BG8]QRM55684.1 GFA family protein [Sinorhizobium sp. BG8]
MEEVLHTGHCLCGAVRFRTRGPLREVIACHCSQCRRQTGHFYAATNARDDHLEVEGSDNVTWYRASEMAARGFCKTCGSALFWKGDGSDTTSIMAGAFDKPTGFEISLHIYCADKGDYYDLDDGLPQYEGNYR